MNYVIRQETPEDYAEVYHMVKASFAATSYSDGTEPDYLNEIRKKSSFIPELSLVAVNDERIIGQIVLYRMQIDCGSRKETQLVISPLSVHPDYFRLGIGSNLVDRGCMLAVRHGYKAVFLCGSSNYYSRFGFVPTFRHNIFHINNKNAEWCMVKELVKGFLDTVAGTVDIQ